MGKVIPERLDVPEGMSLADGQKWAETYFSGQITGVDEVGRGPLAGNVVAAAVVFPVGFELEGIDDSKVLSEKKREALVPIIKKNALAWATGEASVDEIDNVNILNATFLAMRRALSEVEEQGVKFGKVLVDGNHLIREVDPAIQKCVIKGDGRLMCIGAASILAKVYRDKQMAELGNGYPQYNWAKNKGYGSKEHRLAIQEYGRTPWHRKSFSFKEVIT